MNGTVETEEFSDGVKLELERIYHRREIRELQDHADYWRMLCLVTWAIVAACVIVWLSKGALPYG